MLIAKQLRDEKKSTSYITHTTTAIVVAIRIPPKQIFPILFREYTVIFGIFFIL